MCLICADMARGALTFKEAKRNLVEFSTTNTIEPKHVEEVSNLIRDAEDASLATVDPEPFDLFWFNYMD